MADQDEDQARDEGDLFGARVRMARAWANMSQQDLADGLKALPTAKEVPSSLMSIKRIEAGDSTEASREAFAAAVAEATGVPAWVITHGWGEAPDAEPDDSPAALARIAAEHARRIRGIESTVDALTSDYNRTSTTVWSLGREIERLDTKTYEEDARLAKDIVGLSAEIRRLKPPPAVTASTTLRQAAADAAQKQDARPVRKPSAKQRKQG